MRKNEITMQDAFEELRNDLESEEPLFLPAKKIRLSKEMTKEEFISIRKKLGLTQMQLAELLDISVKTVQTYEQGRVTPSGLVSKVLRLLKENKLFKQIFCENQINETSSEKAVLLYTSLYDIRDYEKNYALYETKHSLNTAIIHNTTGKSDTVKVQIPEEYGVLQ